jgi:DNA polymerase-3 subunit delta
MDHRLLLKEINAGKLEKVYFLHGEEPYFIDQLTDAIQKVALEEHERDFNQVILYGKDAEPLSLISELKGFPMMAARKLVILKEAQDFKGMDSLENYAEQPSETTIFVINYKYKTYDSRKKLLKSVAKNGIVFKSDKVKEYQLADWIQTYVKSTGFGITSKASMLLVEFLGNDLARIVNELDKLAIILQPGTAINDVHIEENIGISKDYNVFELNNALAVRDALKAFRIADYFAGNPNAGRLVVIIPTVFKFFTQLMRIHFLPNKSREAIASALKVHPFVAGELVNASRNYNPKQLAHIVNVLHEYDLKSKGVGNTGAFTEGELLKEMIFRILH